VKRIKLLLILATSTDEVFSWFVAWAITGFPDGLGGFMPDSRTQILALQVEASAFAEDASRA
jgi:hypothetical protein